MARSYEGSFDFGWHSHRRGELLQVIDGFMTARVSGASFIIPSGHGLLVAPAVPHAVVAHGCVTMHSLYIEPGMAARLNWDPVRVVPSSSLLSAAVEALLGEPVLYDEHGRGGHLVALILDEISDAAESGFALPEPTDRRLQRLCTELQNAPAIDLDIDDWADKLGMSRRTMTRKFRSETGMSFAEWRRRLRIAHVLRRRAEGAKLEEAALDVGYSSVSALRRAIRDAIA